MTAPHPTSLAAVPNGESRRTEAVAWVVVLSAFTLFVALLIGLPLLGVRYFRTATIAESAHAEPKSGSLAVESRSGIRVLREGDGPIEVYENTTISTDKSAKAFVRFFDGSTLNLDPNARVAINTLRRPRFAADDGSRRIDLVAAGSPGAETRLWVGTTWGKLAFAVSAAGHGTVEVAPESHVRIELDPEVMTVQVQDGEATVSNAGEQVLLRRDERVDVRVGRPPSERTAGPDNVVANGDFDEPPSEATGWTFERTPPFDQTVSPGVSRHQVYDDGRSVVTFERENSRGTSADMFYRQVLGDIDVTSSSFIGISATLRVFGQSLQGGGIEQSEFPAIVKLIFETGNEDLYWRVGFYVVPPELDDPDDQRLVGQHVQVPQGSVYEFGSGNLLDDSNPFGFSRRDPPLPPPEALKRIEVVASGHDYSSEIDSIAVLIK